MHSAFVWCEELCKSWGILSTEAEGRALRDSDRAAAKETIASFASLWIGHFRVPKTLTFKMRPSAQPFLWMSYICMRMKKHFHIKGWALNLVLIQSPGEGGGGELGNGLFILSQNLLRWSRDNTHLTQREIGSNSRDLVLRE